MTRNDCCHVKTASTKCYERVCILALVTRHAPYYVVICGPPGCTIFFHIIS